MAQHIGLERIDENGKTLQRSEVNFANFTNILDQIDDYKSKYKLLSYIDPYGDTYFNRVQIPDLIGELERFCKDNKIEEKELILFLQKIGVHEYIVFRGD